MKRILILLFLTVVVFQACSIEKDQFIGSITITAESNLGHEELAAEIVLDGIPTGEFTPHTFFHLELGRHLIQLLLDDYSQAEPVEITLTRNSPAPPAINIVLIHHTGWLAVQAHDSLTGDPVNGGQIYVDGEPFCTVPSVNSLPTGLRLINYDLSGGFLPFPRDTLLEITRDDTLHLDFALVPAAQAWLRVAPVDSNGSQITDLQIYLDGQLVPGVSTPALVEITAPADHGVAVIGDGYCTWGEGVVSAAVNDTLLWNPLLHRPLVYVEPVADGNPEVLLYVAEGFGGLEVPAVLHPASGDFWFTVAAEGFTTSFPGGWQVDWSCDQDLAYYPELVPGVAGVQPTQVAAGFRLPLFSSTDSLALHALRGRVVLLNFWYANCQPCREELPLLNQVYTEFAAQGLRFVPVDAVPGPNEDALLADFLAEHPEYTFAVPMDYDHQVLTAYEISSTPTNIFIDKTGLIRYRVNGPVTEEQLRQYVEELTSE